MEIKDQKDLIEEGVEDLEDINHRCSPNIKRSL